MFKKGDRVRCVNPDYGLVRNEVYTVACNQTDPGYVWVDDRMLGSVEFFASRFVLATKRPRPPKSGRLMV